MCPCHKNELPNSMVVWLCDYRDPAGARRFRQFDRKADAKAFQATTTVEVSEGRHVAKSQSKTLAHAAAAWIKLCKNGDPTGSPAALEPSTWQEYERHMAYATDSVIGIGTIKLSRLTAGDVDAFLVRLREHPDHRRAAAVARKTRGDSRPCWASRKSAAGSPGTCCARGCDPAATAATRHAKS